MVNLEGARLEEPPGASVAAEESEEARTFLLAVPEAAIVREKDREKERRTGATGGLVTLALTAWTRGEKEAWMGELDEALNALLEAARRRLRPAQAAQIEAGAAEPPAGPPARGEKGEKAGVLEKRASDDVTWKRMHFVLRSPWLFYLKRSSEAGADRSAGAEAGHIYTLNCGVKFAQLPDRANVFQLISPTRIYFFACDRRDEMCKWVNALRASILHGLSNPPEAGGTMRGSSIPGGAGNPLLALLALPGNATCADCGAREPRWADTTYAVFICTECSGIHRRLVPTPIVKACGFGRWDPAQIEIMRSWTNEQANQFYERNVPSYMQRPSERDAYGLKHKYIQAKYIGVPDRQTQLRQARAASQAALAAQAASAQGLVSPAAPPAALAAVQARATVDPAPLPTATTTAASASAPPPAVTVEPPPASAPRAAPAPVPASSPASPADPLAKRSSRRQRMEGALQMRRSSGGWKQLWFRLRSDRLNYYKTCEAEKRSGSIDLLTAQVRSAEDEQDMYVFEVLTPTRIYTLAASSSAEKLRWMRQLKHHIARLTTPSTSASASASASRSTSASSSSETRASSTSRSASSSPSHSRSHSHSPSPSPSASPAHALGVPERESRRKSSRSSHKRAGSKSSSTSATS